ncbi:FHIPEP family type III secretion protein [Sphingorhabdus sp. SMR4y]|uniref:FHIPEP family type III secretion protein n=1 Tax=Sphingorhabdus sp. SMR4y TaxID=2584094 RepID=UPI000B5C9779|nr:FHIPEP family type III secretion protein [Sphingorhabdus sp. SMR4y]
MIASLFVRRFEQDMSYFSSIMNYGQRGPAFDIPAKKHIASAAKQAVLPSILIFLLILMTAPALLHTAILSGVAFAFTFAFQHLREARTGELLAPQTSRNHAVPIERPNTVQHLGFTVNIGYGLFSLVEDRKGAPLISRVAVLRHQISRKLGFSLPHIPIKVDLSLEPNSYRILLHRMVLGEGAAWADEILAIDDGDVESLIKGRPCMDPTFGMNAVWMPARKRTLAVAKGYLVADAATVIATHLHDVAQRNAAKIFGAREAQQLFDLHQQSSPGLADSLTRKLLSLEQITVICRHLLAENISVKDFGRISRAMIRACEVHSDVADIAEAVRADIGDLIVREIVPSGLPLPVITLDASLDSMLVKALKASEGAGNPFAPRMARDMIHAVNIAIQSLPPGIRIVALICSPAVRKPLSDLLNQRFPNLSILSDSELPRSKPVELFATVGGPSSSQTMAATNAT